MSKYTCNIVSTMYIVHVQQLVLSTMYIVQVHTTQVTGSTMSRYTAVRLEPEILGNHNINTGTTLQLKTILN